MQEWMITEERSWKILNQQPDVLIRVSDPNVDKSAHDAAYYTIDDMSKAWKKMKEMAFNNFITLVCGGACDDNGICYDKKNQRITICRLSGKKDLQYDIINRPKGVYFVETEYYEF